MLSGTAIQEVTLDSIAECDFLCRLSTEDDQVGKVTAPFLNVFINARTLAEDSTGWEDLLDGAVYQLGRRQTKVTSVVLDQC